MKKLAAIALCFVGARIFAAESDETALQGLAVDRLVEPLHIDSRPTFSWRMSTGRQGAGQTAYRLTVAESGGGALWDSGEVPGDESLGIKYAGPPLASARRYRWTVSVKDERGNWSSPRESHFSTGILDERDWAGARWIAPDEDGDMTVRVGAFRRDIVNPKRVTSAWWTVAAAGVFELYVNGRALDREFLKPGYTHPMKVRQACTFEVTEFFDVRAGSTNALATVVSAGWSRDRISCRNRPGRRYDARLKPALRSVLVLRYDDGSLARIVTDGTWLSAMDCHPVRTAGIYEGETVDARIATDWLTGSPRGWKAAEIYESGFSGEVRNFRGPPVVRRGDLAMRPVSVTVLGGVAGASDTAFGTAETLIRRTGEDALRPVELNPGQTLVVDFGQNASAIPELAIDAEGGTELELRHAEVLNGGNGERSRGNDGPRGTLYLANLRTSYAGVKYICRGGGESYRPLFTFFGYRYLGVTAKRRITVRSVKSVPVTSIPEGYDTGRFETDNSRVNRLFENCRWGMYSNYLSIPTDCPQRDERAGWMADTQVFAPAAAYLADTYAFLAKWMADVRDSQRRDGCFPWVAPESNAPGYTIGWTDAGVIVPYVLWRRYGETAIIDENWAAMAKYMEYVKARADVDPQHFGDWLSYEYGRDMKWLSPERTKQQLPRKRFLSYAYRIWISRMMAEMAKATGRDEEASLYRRLENEDAAAFRACCLSADGTILPECDGQCSALYALYLDLLPSADAKRATVDALRENFRAHGDCLQTGFLGTAILLDAVTGGMGDAEMAYTLLLQDKNPSWLYSVDQGATTAWERWDSYTRERGFGPARMNSFNHYAYGAVASWMMATMAGIRDDPSGPGFKRMILAPVPDRRIRRVSASFRSPYGTVESSWRYVVGGGWKWDFVIPPNTRATVILPGTGEKKEYRSGRYSIFQKL